jgi:hypothetical protein
MSTNLGTWLGTLASINMIEIFSGKYYSDPLMLGMSLGLLLDFFSGWLRTLRALSTRINFRSLFFGGGSRKESNEIIV